MQFLAALFAVCLVIGCASAPRETGRALAETPRSLRVMTFNIHHGEGLDGRLDLDRIATLIVEARADLVSVQEVDKGLQRTGRRDMPAELAKLTGMTCVFSNNFATQGGEYGNAILSRFPVLSTMNHPLPRITANEPRGLLETVVSVHGRQLRFMATHLDHRRQEEDRLAGVERILQVVRDGLQPVIIAGDFNASPESETYRRLRAALEDAWTIVGEGPGHTIPASNPSRRIDYVFFTRPDILRPRSATVISSASSDHLPVVVEFELR